MRNAGMTRVKMWSVLLGGLLLLSLTSGRVAWGGEKEELQSQLKALQMEERAINAEAIFYQSTLKELQNRFPVVKAEQAAIQGKLRAIEDKAKAEQKPVLRGNMPPPEK
jgi:hypothetical protein